jgi:GxxExxY protein
MAKDTTQLLHSDLTKKIIGACHDVDNEVGHGFLESVYSNCMHRALNEAGLSAQREVSMPVFFQGWDVGLFKADLVVNKLILVELKAVLPSIVPMRLK